MKSKKFILSVVVLVLLAGASGITYYYWYQNSNYITTEDARVTANLINVTPLIPGKVLSWNRSVGEEIKAGDNLGWLDTGSVATSGGINTATLNPIGSITANKSEIAAPIAGEIIKSNVEQGQMVAPGQTLAIIADTKDMYISANIEETKISKVKIGQPVEVTIDSQEGKAVMGQVDEIGKATVSTFSILPIQSSNGNFTKVTQLIPVKIRIPGMNELKLLPGMSVEIKIHIAD